MSTKHFSDGAAHASFSPYESPYQAFTNYMNVLADFIVRVEEQYPLTIENEELNALLTTIKNQESEIEMLNKELKALKDATEETKSAIKPKAQAKTAPAATKKAAPKKKAATVTIQKAASGDDIWGSAVIAPKKSEAKSDASDPWGSAVIKTRLPMECSRNGPG